MDKAVYLAMTGAKHTMLSQAVNSHNLANINTPGFKADKLDFRSVFLGGQGHDSRVYSVVQGTSSNLESGPINATGNPLDIAVRGEGWIAVQDADGKEAYTRAGNLRAGPGGQLVNGAGHVVLGSGGPITLPPDNTLAIGNDGTISIVGSGEGPEAISSIDRIKLVNPPAEQLRKGDDGLFRLPKGAQAPADAAVQVASGHLESSNVSAVGALVQMIELARTWELQVKAMQTFQENDRADAQIISLN